MSSDREVAWSAVHDVMPPNWFLGRRLFVERYNHWVQFAYDTTDRGRPGKPRTRQWTALGETEVECVREMGRCLRIIGQGAWPK
jgi:hypothetical protein